MSKVFADNTIWLHSKEITSLQRGKFKLACPQMRLERPSTDGGRVFTGSGVIEQSTDHQLTFVLHTVEPYSDGQALEDLVRLSNRPLGEIIPADEYYSLTATDTEGRTWASEGIAPDITQHRDDPGATCRGNLSKIVYKTTTAVHREPEVFRITIFGDFVFPLNTSIAPSRARTKQPHPGLNALQFTYGDVVFLFHKSKAILTVQATVTARMLPDNVELRVLEALQFVFARPILYSVAEEHSSNGSSLVIYSRRKRQTESRLFAPLRLDLHGVQDDFGELFGRYLAFVSTHPADTFHPVSAQLNSVYYASAGYFETQATATSITIESILKEAFSDVGQPSETTKRGIAAALEYVQQWPDLDGVRVRVDGAIRAMSHPRALEQLMALEKKNIITEEQRVAWNKLRNKIAHTGRLDGTPVQELTVRLDVLTVLLYSLVFYAIGYQGQYTDYGAPGWPTKQFIITE